jgi:hypothetical protein
MKYLIHDNGGRPFLVQVKGKNVQVYKNSRLYDRNTDDDEYDHMIKTKTGWDELILSFEDVVRVFVDQTPRGRGGLPSDWKGDLIYYQPKGLGNSVLVQVTENKYVFIGWEIFSFISNDPVKKYYSPIGNNDVPYPFAVTKGRKVS